MVVTMPGEASRGAVAQRGAQVPGLETARRARLLTQKQLATAAGVAPSTVVRAERGAFVDFASITKLAAALHVEAAVLLGAAPERRG